MKIRLFFLAVLFSITSCVNNEKYSNQIVVDLDVVTADNPFRRSNLPLVYLDSIPDEIKGVVNRDSSFVMYLNTVSPKALKNKIKQGIIKQEVIDSINTKIYVLSGYNNGKQYYVIDQNNNSNFNDDKRVEFGKGITNYKNYRDSFAVKSLELTKLSGDQFYKQQSYLQFIPAPKYFTYKNETEEEKFKHSLQLVAVKDDFLYGSFELENRQYGVGANKGLFGNEFIFKKSDTTFYSPNHQLFAKFELKDTIKLNNKYFRIDSLSSISRKLFINKIEIDGKFYGFRTNTTSKNYQINNLDGELTTLKDLAKEKGFLLLDFWGTWCVPCKELTPELVDLNEQYKKKIQFVSLAFELDPKPVQEYITKNQMNWYSGLIKGKPKSGDKSSPLIKGLKIKCYPTFIVLDSELNILFRTCGGGDNFLELKEFLKSNFE